MLIAAFILLLAAFACIAAELFLPSHGILALCACLLALLAIILGFRSQPAAGLLIALAVVLFTPAVFWYTIKIYPQTPMGKRVMLKTPPTAVTDPFAEESQRLSQLVGRRAITVSTLRLAGTIELDGQRIDAISESEVIPLNTQVEILRVTGLKVIVKPVV